MDLCGWVHSRHCNQACGRAGRADCLWAMVHIKRGFCFCHFRLLFCAQSSLVHDQPDLPIRLQKNIPLTPYNREVFYTVESPVGYTDYLPADASVTAAA